MAAPHLHRSTREYIASPAVARDYDRYFSGQDLFAYDSALLQQWFDRPGRLIDLGCGTGRHVVQFARRRFDVIGIDLSPEMLAEARAKLDRHGLTATLLQADFCDLPGDPGPGDYPADGSCDYAICMFNSLGLIFGHANRLAFLKSVRRLLKPTGQLALHVHNRSYNLWRHEGRLFLLANAIKVRLSLAEPGDKFMRTYRGIRRMYIHVFTQGEISALLEQAGFAIMDLLALNPRRNGPLKPRWLPKLFANGFLIRARCLP